MTDGDRDSQTRQKRPSSASAATGTGTGSPISRDREDVTPWEFQATSSPREVARHRKIKINAKSPPGGPRGAGVSSHQRPKTASASLSFSQPSMASSSSLGGMLSRPMSATTTTGSVADVTPWELYPTPRPRSTSASVVTTSTETHNSAVASQCSSQVHSPVILQRRNTTGPVDQVTPWELTPFPAKSGNITAPPSPSAKSNKIRSLFKSKPDAKFSERPRSAKSIHLTSPSTHSFTPLPDIPLDLMEAFGGQGFPPVMVQCTKKSISELSDRSRADSKVSLQSNFKSRKDRPDLSSHGVAERSKVKDVAPWDMHPLPKKLTISIDNPPPSGSSLINLVHIPATPSSVMSPTIEMWRSQKSAGQSPLVKGSGYYRREDGRSMSSSALPLSTGGLKRARANSVAATSEGWNKRGERTVASSASMSVRSGRSSRDGQHDSASKVDPERQHLHLQQEATFSHSRDSVALSNLSRGKSVTGQTANSSRSSIRPWSSSALGHGEKIGATSLMSTMNLAQMEEVIPWELHPIPISVQRWSEERDRKTSRASTSSAAGKALAEFGLKRRRSPGKTSGSSAGMNRLASASGISFTASKDSVPIPSLPTSSSGGKGISNTSLLPISAIASSSTASSAKSRGIRSEREPISSSHTSEPASDVNLQKFSTADRTILEELKANLRAREAQFLIKGVGHTMVGGRRCPGKKYHPYRKSEVPYPRSYDREVVDLDVWETMFWLDLCKGLTWHTFETPPTKVLEIGCGTGTWILEAATTWKECHFVGLDIVPLHPNLKNLAGSDAPSRITWVQHNFLDGLPFQNEEFDFVHIKRIALGIPEDKWDKFLEEVQRVMKPGGAFEMIEEDLFFPGKPIDDNDDLPAASTDTNEAVVLNGATTLRPMPQIDEREMVGSFSNSDNVRDARNTMGRTRTAPTLFDPLDTSDDIAPRDPRDHTILQVIWNGMLESRFVNPAPLSILPTYLEYHFQDVRTHPPLLYSLPPLPNEPTPTEVKNITSGVTSQPSSKSSASSDADHPEDGSTKPTTRHRSLYVALDESRSDALCPSDLAHSPKKFKSHLATLPDQSLNLDIRTLNLHLALRAKEIIACSEPMWEWVQEFQIKRAKKPRFRSDSIEIALLGSTRAFNGHDAEVLIKDAMLDMTRDDFDQILNNFQLDMQDKASIKLALEQRFSWTTFTSEPLQDRKSFDAACQRYDEWLAHERIRLGHGHPHLSNNPSNVLISKGAAHLSADPSPAFSTSTTDSHIPRQLSSCQQLSRAMRVFVAWKESA